jgi:hypothetical protein
MKKIFVVLLFFSCQDKNSKKHTSIHLSGKDMDYSIIQNTYSVKDLVESLETSNCVYGKVVGLGGKKSPVYENYEKLFNLLNDTAWYKLCQSKGASMRFYAYKALYSKKSPLINEAWELLKNDRTSICWQSNDLELNCSLNYLIEKSFR